MKEVDYSPWRWGSLQGARGPLRRFRATTDRDTRPVRTREGPVTALAETGLGHVHDGASPDRPAETGCAETTPRLVHTGPRPGRVVTQSLQWTPRPLVEPPRADPHVYTRPSGGTGLGRRRGSTGSGTCCTVWSHARTRRGSSAAASCSARTTGGHLTRRGVGGRSSRLENGPPYQSPNPDGSYPVSPRRGMGVAQVPVGP